MISGEIDHYAAGPIRDEIDEMIRRTRPIELVLDFNDVQFMDSSGIGLVMGRYKLMKTIGGNVSITNVRQHIYKIMLMSGVQKIASISERK